MKSQTKITKQQIISPTMPVSVEAVFQAYPDAAHDVLLRLRALIFKTAATNPAIGPLTETLKWGQASYLTEASKSGSTVRLGHTQEFGAIYLNCKTTLVDRMRETYPDTFTYQGTRGILFPLDQPLPNDALAHGIEMALTYHLNKP